MWSQSTKKLANLKDKYEFLKDPKPSDIVIGVIGCTGVGKSTFTNVLLGDEVAAVGRRLKSATSKVQHYEYKHLQHADRRILVVDTPGFDDGDLSEKEVLERIAVWLAKSYEEGMSLAGLIYIFDITSDRYTASETRSYRIFEALCGKDWATKVVLATSKWDKLDNVGDGEDCEKQLTEEYWSDMYGRGSTIHRLGRSRDLAGKSAKESAQESAQKIIDSILSHVFRNHIAIQEELVNKKKDLTTTMAWRIAAGTEISWMRHILERSRKLVSHKVGKI